MTPSSFALCAVQHVSDDAWSFGSRACRVCGMMSFDMETAALILIDMQQGMGSAAAGERNNPGAERNMQRLLAAWRQLEWRAIYRVEAAEIQILVLALTAHDYRRGWMKEFRPAKRASRSL